MWINSRFTKKLGKAFSDNVTYSTRKPLIPKQAKLRGWGARITLLYILLLSLFFLLSVRLFHLTIARGEENRNLSEFNRIKTSVIHAPRGVFLDRTGKPLVKNTPAFRVTGPCNDKEVCHTRFMTAEELATSGIDTRSVFLEPDYFREYIYPYETAHVLGYLGELTAEELTNPFYIYQGYTAGDRLGRTGLENVFEKKLRGVDGKELVEIDAEHRRKRTLGRVDALPGQDITLSLDAQLQKTAYEAMGDLPGAIVVSKPKTGEILAFVSTPSFDPNKFQLGISQSDYEALLATSDKPLYDRALSGTYPPGSSFKLIVATAALESGKITKDQLFEDTGKLTVGAFSFGNWYYLQYGKTEGMVDLYKGIARSNDIYFYHLGETVGPDALAVWGKKFGIGSRTGIELPGEAEGVMPDPEWRKKVRGDDWYLGDTYHLAIGQGDLAVTPLQVNMWTNAIASGGVLCHPTLLKAEGASSVKKNCTDMHIKKETITAITEGMRRACSKGDDTGYQGTGWPLFDFTVTRETLTEGSGTGEKNAVDVACKTGTSEIGDSQNSTHAWFTAFAPLPGRPLKELGLKTISAEPEIVVTVLVEKGGEGSTVAGPIAKKILDEWFKR